MNISLSALLAGIGTAGITLAALPVRAHINMEGALQDRGGDQKSVPCGGLNRGSGPIYTFELGATITLGVAETIAHPGYFRIAFDADGDDSFVDPASIDPIDPDRYGPGVECGSASTDRCGESDFCNSPAVLWDNLNPHVPLSFLGGASWSWTIKLPDVECDNCTIQVIQVMEDPLGHGDFDGVNDLYYRCVDVVLERGAGNTPGTTTEASENDGLECPSSGEPGGSDRDGGVSNDAGRDAGASQDSGSDDDASDEADEEDGAADGSTEPEDSDDEDEDEGDVGENADGGCPRPLARELADNNGGCALGPQSSGKSAAWLLLVLGVVIARKRKVFGG